MPIPVNEMPRTLAKPRAAQERQSPATILLIGLFKLLKGVLLLFIAVGASRMLHKDIAAVVTHWVDILRVDPDNRFIHRLLVRVMGVNPRQLREISAGTFFYSGILLTEGIGLLMRKRWAEYFTVISTGVFIPLEVYEIFHHFRWVKVGVLLVNVAIVWYLVERIRRR
jgi:uncharacterized membrane protein (DUF2068 family)